MKTKSIKTELGFRVPVIIDEQPVASDVAYEANVLAGDAKEALRVAAAAPPAVAKKRKPRGLLYWALPARETLASLSPHAVRYCVT